MKRHMRSLRAKLSKEIPGSFVRRVSPLQSCLLVLAKSSDRKNTAQGQLGLTFQWQQANPSSIHRATLLRIRGHPPVCRRINRPHATSQPASQPLQKSIDASPPQPHTRGHKAPCVVDGRRVCNELQAPFVEVFPQRGGPVSHDTVSTQVKGLLEILIVVEHPVYHTHAAALEDAYKLLLSHGSVREARQPLGNLAGHKDTDALVECVEEFLPLPLEEVPRQRDRYRALPEVAVRKVSDPVEYHQLQQTQWRRCHGHLWRE
mmetsp:Transcript_53206/g.133950  ORF Transcript_53206/g.133950 Transcript_53206/m.133950 type:complete len:261 (-) Transcript_53206:773-1555(-)